MPHILDWCKNSCSFYIVEICHLILEYILKCGYVIYHSDVHFLLYGFFANSLLLAVYFICILDYGNYVKKQIWVIFLFKFKMGHKAAEATCNINNTFDPGIANECTVQWCFKKFCKGDEFLEDEEYSGWPSQVDNNQLRAIIETHPLATMWEVSK